ncbi:MAG TPA: Hsp20/alpha crystallin family protein [Steroidobacteraceae bacterium]|jgi:HSP20 family protein|nr:Hsp20/alpha crystallin family protein [Steroidobacteraceae bacterium]
MSLVRWDPFASLDDMVSRMPSVFGRWPRMSNDGDAVEWSPSVDISETETEYLLKAQLPAVKREDVHVTYDDGMLTISGERKQEQEQKGEKFHRIESFHGAFSRSFSLPEAIHAGTIRAEAKDGVITVHVPKSKVEVKKPTEIKIQ